MSVATDNSPPRKFGIFFSYGYYVKCLEKKHEKNLVYEIVAVRYAIIN